LGLLLSLPATAAGFAPGGGFGGRMGGMAGFRGGMGSGFIAGRSSASMPQANWVGTPQANWVMGAPRMGIGTRGIGAGTFGFRARGFADRDDFAFRNHRFFDRDDFAFRDRRFFDRDDFAFRNHRFFDRDDFFFRHHGFFPRHGFNSAVIIGVPFGGLYPYGGYGYSAYSPSNMYQPYTYSQAVLLDGLTLRQLENGGLRASWSGEGVQVTSVTFSLLDSDQGVLRSRTVGTPPYAVTFRRVPDGAAYLQLAVTHADGSVDSAVQDLGGGYSTSAY
jgi:hypothetical protein